MPLTSLDPRTALVLIDFQRGVRALAGAVVDEPLARGAELAAAFRAAGQLVVLVRVSFAPDFGDMPRNRTERQGRRGTPQPGGADLLPELDQQPGDLVVTKHQLGAFYGTDLDLQLRRRQVTGVVLGGVATSRGVESTARAAYDHDYNVTFASDAMADMEQVAHDHCLAVTFPHLGEVDTTAAIIAALPRR